MRRHKSWRFSSDAKGIFLALSIPAALTCGILSLAPTPAEMLADEFRNAVSEQTHEIRAEKRGPSPQP